MSVPQQQAPPKSPTPSKSSLRRANSDRNSSQRNLIPSPSPRFEDQATTEVRYSPRSPPNQTLEYDSNEDDEDDEDDPDVAEDDPLHHGFEHHHESYFQVPTAQELPRPFEPLFTLIEDSLTTEHHHPSMHYIFADDDHEIVTEAAIRSLEADQTGEASTTVQETSATSHEYSASRLPALQPGVKEHYLILDIQPLSGNQSQSVPQSQIRTLSQMQTDDSTTQQSTTQPVPFVVSSCTSLSPDWQISSASITSAPTMSNTVDEDETFMLRIEGRGFASLEQSDTEIPAAKGKQPLLAEVASSNNAEKGREKESLEESIERFQVKLNEIRKLMEMDSMSSLTVPTLESGMAAGDVVQSPSVRSQNQPFDLEAQD